MMHSKLLENPIWSALTSAHKHLAIGDAHALRYPPEITTMAAFADLSAVTDVAWRSLGDVMQPRETIAVLFRTPPEAPSGWEIVARVEIVQMVHDQKSLPESKQA